MKQARTNAMFSLTVLLAYCACSFALDPSLDVSQYAHTSWKVRDGFTKGAINCIAQTEDGYLWLGTEFGLYRFDGVRAVLWQPQVGQQLPSNNITSLLASRDGTLWIGTSKGLATWKNGKLAAYAELSSQVVFALREDREGTVWAGGISILSGGRLCAIRSGSIQCHGEDGSLGPEVVDLFEDSGGSLWVSVKDGFWRWKPGSSEFFAVPGEPDGVRFGEGDEGGLIVGGATGMRRVRDGNVQPFLPADIGQRFMVTRVLRDRDGALWIGTSRGLVHVHDGKTDIFSVSDNLTGDRIDYLLEDREGNVWVATLNGLDRFRGYSVSTLSTKQGLSNDNPYSVLGARDGTVWIGTPNAWDRWDHGRIVFPRIAGPLQKIAGKLSRFSPGSIFQDSEARLWAANYDAFGHLEGDRFVPVAAVPPGYVHSIAEVPPGHLWVAHQEAGLFHLFNGKMTQQIPWAGLGHKDHVNILAADPSERGLWLGFFQGGVAYFADGGVREYYPSGNGLGEGEVNDLRFGPDGALWVGTQGGLGRIKDGKVATLTSKSGLPCDSVLWTLEDDEHAVWLLMPCGLVRLAKSELDAWAADHNKVISYALFDSSDGVRSRAYPSGYTPHAAKSPDGRIWFTAWDGVSVIDPHHLPFNKLSPQVHIEQITADGKAYDPAQGLRLPARVQHIDIDYTALSLVTPEKNRFRVKLEGYDRDWRDVGNRRQAFYTNLPPHNYRFRVMASNNSGVWNEEGASLDFDIPPAWYQMLWFRAVCVSAFFLLLWSAYLLRVRHLRRQEKKLRDVVETMPTFAWTALPDGSVDFVNRHWQEFTGLSTEKTVGSGWESAVHSADLKRHVEKWRDSIATGEPFENEVRYRQGEDGQYRWFLARAVPLRDCTGKIVKWYGISTDIEDRKRAEQEREKLREDLGHVNRISMLGELSASLSHELKQPITAAVISANTTVEWLNRKQPDVENARESAATIVTAGMRAAEIIDRLRSLYKKAPPQRRLLDVNEIVGEMIALLRSEGNSYAISMRAELAPDLPQVMADQVQVQQVLMNLMLNAIEAMKETGGVLTVKSQSQDGYVVVSVSDTGVGLPPERAEQIFDAFFTTKPQGSGMGLAISRSIIESHGGRLWATPNNGRGASFHFSLPTATAAAEAPAKAG